MIKQVSIVGPVLMLATVLPLGAEEGPTAELRDGDRVTWIGAAFVERMQQHGYLEALLTSAYPERQITFRNLGWSGDTVWGESRALFGTQPDGLARLIKDTLETRPTVIVLCYGANEAFAGGKGLERFQQGLSELAETLQQQTGARLVLLSPHGWERAPRGVDREAYHASLARYAEVLQQTARARRRAYVSLLDLLDSAQGLPVTRHGLHLSGLGYWQLAPEIARRLGAPPRPAAWSVLIDQNKVETAGTEVDSLVLNDRGLRFVAVDERLPYPDAFSLPGNWELRRPAIQRKLTARLPDGEYELRIDQHVAGRYGHDALADGISFVHQPARRQWEQLRQTIVDKNELYFHRYRPQNETYLFLFRKHEQGNNAVEIPQFDPLVKKLEEKIAALRKPKPYTFELKRLVSDE